ncbi:MAG: hypothetical protein K0U16_07880 [Gammaproteobacteria bacterium]|jgi:hypothetical protein|nr:hypothetical protein [Gammaproteobacteria bacterium]|tara:strand:- start:785 stop:1123 length:339 start_codon:yes stop_codon:yes gene_type:complete
MKNMLNTIMNTLVNPLTIGASLTVVGAAGLVGGMFSDVLSYTIPIVGINLGTLMYVVPLSVGVVTLARRYAGMDVPFLGMIADEAAAETGFNWGENSSGPDNGNGVPIYYGS